MLLKKLDARIALVLVSVFSLALFLIDTWCGMIVAFAAVILFLLAGNPYVIRILVSLFPLYIILAITVIAHIPQGISLGFFYALRILILALATLCVAFGYDDTQLVRAMASLLSPLRALRVPVDDIATTFSIALRFIPVSMNEVQRVYIAQKSRGVVFDEGSYSTRISHWGNVFVPVIVGLFRRAENIAEAMESRCYSGGVRTSLHRSCLTSFDVGVLCAGLLLSVSLTILF